MKFIWKKSDTWSHRKKSGIPPTVSEPSASAAAEDTTHDVTVVSWGQIFLKTEESGQLNENQPIPTCLALAKTALKHWPILAPLIFFSQRPASDLRIFFCGYAWPSHTRCHDDWSFLMSKTQLETIILSIKSIKTSPTTLKNPPEMSWCWWKIRESPFAQIAWVWWRCTCKQSSTAWRLTVNQAGEVCHRYQNQDIGLHDTSKSGRPKIFQQLSEISWFHLPFW